MNNEQIELGINRHGQRVHAVRVPEPLYPSGWKFTALCTVAGVDVPLYVAAETIEQLTRGLYESGELI